MRPRGRAGCILLGLALLAAGAARGSDYCVDAATGSDAASGLCSDRPWATLDPTVRFPFQAGDTVHVAAGTYNYPATGMCILAGVRWSGGSFRGATDHRSSVRILRLHLAEQVDIRGDSGTPEVGPQVRGAFWADHQEAGRTERRVDRDLAFAGRALANFIVFPPEQAQRHACLG